MSKKQPTINNKGITLDILILIFSQLIIGVIHSFFGLLLVAYENHSSIYATPAYDIFTFVFGLLVLFFAVLIWRGNKAGWIGMVVVSLFVIAADSLILLDLPSIPGIPKFPAITEIAYSILIVFYLLQSRVRKKF